MEIITFYILIIALLSTAIFITKRRFGLLALALSAGYLINGIWGSDVEAIVLKTGAPSSVVTTVLIRLIIVLLPAGILLFHGYSYKTLIGKIFGAILFSALSIAFLAETINYLPSPQGFIKTINDFFIINHKNIIGLGLVIAVIDIFLTKPVSSGDKKSKH